MNSLKISLICLSFLLGEGLYASEKSSALDLSLERLKSDFKAGKITEDKFYQQIFAMSDEPTLSPVNRGKVAQMMALHFLKEKYPILASHYAIVSINEEALSDRDLKPSWLILKRATIGAPNLFMLEKLSENLKFNRGKAGFGNDWHYVEGLMLQERDKPKKARSHFARLVMGDRYFLPGTFQKGVIDYTSGDLKSAAGAFLAVLNETALSQSPLSYEVKEELQDYAHLGLGRIYYEERKFKESIRHYRMVRKKGNQYYNALFEQAWSLFMGGYPKHALGALYGVESPFFSKYYNPEAKILEATSYYWMCRYDDAKNSLADFAKKHSDSIESLDNFLKRQRLNPQTAYQLFENLVSGVSSSSLGLPRDILTTIASQDTLMLPRRQYGEVIDEYKRVRRDTSNVYAANLETFEKILEGYGEALQVKIGEAFLTEMRSYKEHFDDLYDQSQFLYLELLMSEKEQLMGRELHASSKLSRLDKKAVISGWSQNAQSWQDKIGEYWWDEIGFHILAVEPKCLN